MLQRRKTSSGTGITVPNGKKAHLYADGTNVIQMVDYFVSPTLTTPTINGATVAGDITITGTGRRITGDFSNATVADRVMFQTSTTNGETALGVIPNGTSPNSGVNIFNAANPTNAAFGGLLVGTTEFQIRSAITGSGTYLPLTFYTGGSERVRVDTSGNVGIGTSSPGEKFVVEGNASVDIYKLRANTSAPTSTDAFIYRPADNTLGFGTASNERVRIDSSGNVGIGTTTPSGASGTALEVNGGAGQARLVLKNNTTGSASTDGSQIALVNSQLVIQNREASETIFETNGNERMRIDSSGNVGIGTATSSGKLTVTTSSGQGGHFSTSGGSGFPVVASVNFASSTAIAGVRVVKYDNNTTTSQVFVQFAVNQDSSNSGQINANGANTAAFGTYSDARLKENITDLPSQLASILALRPVEFDYIQSEGGGHQIGFIAQEMEQIYPDVVGERADGMKTITAWSKTEARLVKAIQEQQAVIKSLAARITALEQK